MLGLPDFSTTTAKWVASGEVTWKRGDMRHRQELVLASVEKGCERAIFALHPQKNVSWHVPLPDIGVALFEFLHGFRVKSDDLGLSRVVWDSRNPDCPLAGMDSAR